MIGHAFFFEFYFFVGSFSVKQGAIAQGGINVFD